MDRSWSLKFSFTLLLSGATVWAALKATAREQAGRSAVGEGEATVVERFPQPDGTIEAAQLRTAAAAVADEATVGTGAERSSASRPEEETSGAPSVGERSLPPDLLQTDPALALPGDGLSYCGPVAVSNSLTWLAENGFERMAPSGETSRARQIELVREISSRRYMATSPAGGTGPSGVLRGLSRWISDAGYQAELLAYQGWRGHPAKFSTGVKHPQVPWIAAALAKGGAAWLHVGWYHRKPYQPGFHRRGGHWLTVVAVEDVGAPLAQSLLVSQQLRSLEREPDRTCEESGASSAEGPQVCSRGIRRSAALESERPDTEADPTTSRIPVVIRVRDSAPYAGERPTLETLTLEELQKEWLFDAGAAVPAKGYLKISSGLSLKRSDDVPIIDGAIVLVLARG